MSKKEKLYNDLKHRILTLDLEPGANLDETRLGEEYALSRTPVRDILRQLAGEGYLIIEENRGAFVAPMSHKTLRDFFLTAPPVYASIAALAVDNWKPAQLAALKEAQEGFRKGIEASDVDQMAFYNNRFHLIMGEMADNQYLWPSLQRLLIDHARIGQTFYSPRNESLSERLSEACDHHDLFIAAIENRDRETARRLAFDHWELSRDSIEMFVRPDPLDMDITQLKAV
ncbi:GntR family transcriptional regulator [Pelagibius sp. Alg239-R121]|uniref:GntR family transcriptional regulator n=1 Tax=Pelagibius sp. Alg239-R121 TaxID=2993448 RepID=UPI0024A68C0E|nr:GntR family transcriptional regulator [Pelagibius sp. Alg239-R121]